jgi:hypothetical protein
VRRDELLRRKDDTLGRLESMLQAANLPIKDHKAAETLLDAFELLLDVWIDIAHPVPELVERKTKSKGT